MPQSPIGFCLGQFSAFPTIIRFGTYISMLIINCHNVVSETVSAFDCSAAPRITLDRFITSIDMLSRHYTFISFEEMLARAKQNRPNASVATLTFDDGYQGVINQAFPVLKARGIVASVMVVTQTLEHPKLLLHFEELELALRISTKAELDLPDYGRLSLETPQDRIHCLWKLKQELKVQPESARAARHDQVLRLLSVTHDQLEDEAGKHEFFSKLAIKDLHALANSGWTIGSHTRTHRTLRRLDDRDAMYEIMKSQDDIRTHLGISQMPLAYPYGGKEHVGRRIQEMARKCGYSCALSTESLEVGLKPNLFSLPRIDITAYQPMAHYREMAGSKPAF